MRNDRRNNIFRGDYGGKTFEEETGASMWVIVYVFTIILIAAFGGLILWLVTG